MDFSIDGSLLTRTIGTVPFEKSQRQDRGKKSLFFLFFCRCSEKFCALKKKKKKRKGENFPQGWDGVVQKVNRLRNVLPNFSNGKTCSFFNLQKIVYGPLP